MPTIAGSWPTPWSAWPKGPAVASWRSGRRARPRWKKKRSGWPSAWPISPGPGCDRSIRTDRDARERDDRAMVEAGLILRTLSRADFAMVVDWLARPPVAAWGGQPPDL